MLKRLLLRGRSETEEIAETTEVPDAPAVTADDVDIPSPPDAPQTTPPPAPKIRRKRKAGRSRASDVRDENGRTAEEIAAEANKDFDILAVARRAAELPDIVPATKDKAENSEQPKELATVSPALDDADPGHLVMPGADLDAAGQTQDARDAYWTQWGESDPDFIGYETNPQALGAPAWPTERQTFRLVRTEYSLIIASEGLSDPFGPFSGGGTTNGFGLEVFMEITGWQDMRLKEVKGSWAFLAVEHLARVAAHARGLDAVMSGAGLVSMDLPHAALPESWGDPDCPEMPGGLVGMALPPGLDFLTNTPLSKVRMVPLTMITPDELETCVIGGAEDRQALANDLLTTGVGHRTVPDRMSLR